MGMVCPIHGVVLTVQGMVSAENVYFCQMLSPRPVVEVAGASVLEIRVQDLGVDVSRAVSCRSLC
jgi:hypothetical protein